MDLVEKFKSKVIIKYDSLGKALFKVLPWKKDNLF